VKTHLRQSAKTKNVTRNWNGSVA